MAEIVAAASECPGGQLHQWPEVSIIEILSDTADVAVPAGSVGRVVGTSLLNSEMPLIRYDTGDRAAISPRLDACECGRALPMLDRIEGRSNDLVLTPDGRRVYWLNPTFYGLPLHEAQIIQDRVDRLRVLVVPAPGYTPDTARTIVERLQSRLGRLDVQVEVVKMIPRTSGGKFRSVVSNLPLETTVDQTTAG